MLVIRDAQLGVFKGQAIARFEDAMLARIRTAFPLKYECLGESPAREFIRRAIRSGANHKVTTRGAVAVLIELMLQYGEQFELSPDQSWAWKILTHGTLPAHLKVDTIRDRFEPLSQGRLIVPLDT